MKPRRWFVMVDKRYAEECAAYDRSRIVRWPHLHAGGSEEEWLEFARSWPRDLQPVSRGYDWKYPLTGTLP